MTLIKPDDAWSLWAVLIGWAAVSILLEQKYDWAAKISGAVIALFGALILANLNIIPTESPVYDAVWSYVVPVAIPLLLFKANIRKIWTESGRMILAFWPAALGTCVGAFVATVLLKNVIPELGKIGGIMTASYIGGGVNFVAMTAVFKPQESLLNATIVSDNLVMAAFFLLYMYIPTLKYFQKNFKILYPDGGIATINTEAETKAAAYWGRKEISLKDIATAMAVGVAVAAISKKLSILLGAVMPGGNFLFDMLKIMVSNQYFLITTITVTLVTIFSDFFENINGAQELGTFLIYIFFVVIGVPASIKEIILKSPALLLFCVIMAFFNLIFSLYGNKFLNISLEESLLASNATIGGPTTAAAMAISRGWSNHIIPALLCGIWGYVTGNYFGLFMGNWLIRILGQ
ncbi:DUF819 domain-containing protein [Thermosediminibacter oceani]|uniref:DUF819 domain-containing protein n=1 Tax=Thermosediminibacter oceani (strain ATCC BAA-1034 / DSM 16646 / JW/IW-1228P) TaxID=555079 RepID=D9S094_THEOJ|nr:DUF819 family protein [Thermosediminibacter oceani]ADL07022.1 protein of unknown function DUF819 [Thermosediminibacter oceani DSM 16646]